MDQSAPPGPPVFLPGSRLWLVTRHADVGAALRDPSMVPPGSGATDGHPAPGAPSFDELLAPARWTRLRPSLEQDLDHLVDRLPRETPVDLVGALASPWCLGLARRLLELDAATAEEGLPLARRVFGAASRTPDGAPDEGATGAAAALATLLSRNPGPGDPAARVQAFVALTCTLPRLLAGAWGLLLAQEDAPPLPGPRLLEEVLRLAGPAGRVFRDTTAGAHRGGVWIPAGARVALDLAAANRDPDRFPEPERLDPGRGVCPHVALGAGLHPCAGAALVRDALRLGTEVLFAPGRRPTLAGPWAPPVGSEANTIRGPETLPVVFAPVPGPGRSTPV